MNWNLGLLRNAAVPALVTLLAACAMTPVQRDVAGVGGFWEQDENTDPRFERFDRPPGVVIGTLRVAGDNVFLNDRRITRSVQVMNHSHLRTGAGSGARIDFEPGPHGRCRIGILDLHMGRGYGNTARCLHHMETPQGSGLTGTGTVYNVDIRHWQTQITVIRGRLEAWLTGDPQRRVAVASAQEVVLTPDEIIGPREISQADIRQRTAWRSKFTFFEPTQVRDPSIQPWLDIRIPSLFNGLRDRDRRETEPGPDSGTGTGSTDEVRPPNEDISPPRTPTVPQRMRITPPVRQIKPSTDSTGDVEQQPLR